VSDNTMLEQQIDPDAIIGRSVNTRWWVDIGDTHLGSQFAVTPPNGFLVDGGARVPPNPLQRVINEFWEEFWHKCHKVMGNESFILTHKGDVIEGHHHRSKEAISFNFKDQRFNAEALLLPHTSKAERVWFARGTPAHAGEESEHEEEVARACGAQQDYAGRYTWPMVKFDWNGLWVNVAHHIGVSGVSASQATAVMAEVAEMQRWAGKMGIRVPDIITRGHRHSSTGVWDLTPHGVSWSATTPGWQGRTGYTMKQKGGRTSELCVGGLLWEYSDTWGAIPHPIHCFILENDGDPRIVRGVG